MLCADRMRGKMQLAICDDEKEVREILAEKVKELYPKADIVLYNSGEELLLSKRQPDILLMDIRLPGKDGMETARELRKQNKKTMLIFVTGRKDYVFQAFDVGAFHYLVKPFDDEKFIEVLKSAVAQWEEMPESKKIETSFVVYTGGKHISVCLDDIIYAEVFNRKIIIHTIDSDIDYYGKMKELERIAGNKFYRSHRAYLINFKYVKKYDSKTIYFERGQALMAKQNYGDFVKSYLRYNQRKVK